jgi:hypothetical protein
MPKGYWLATYKKIESKDNLRNYVTVEIHLLEEGNINVLKEMIFQEL